MVIWGGEASTRFDTGARYDVATDHWYPMTTTSAPSPRTEHTDVAAGGLVFVWGGYNPSVGVSYNTGGRYDPDSDVWTPTSTVGAPPGRRNATSVWTGDVVIVWGGASSDTGGRYSIVTVDDDHDGISDHCDNCAGTANSNQADADMDGFGDVCDCAPLDSGAFSFPEEVGGVQLAPDATTLTWLSSAPRAGSGTVHDVLRGILADLPVGGPSGVCLDSGDPGAESLVSPFLAVEARGKPVLF